MSRRDFKRVQDDLSLTRTLTDPIQMFQDTQNKTRVQTGQNSLLQVQPNVQLNLKGKNILFQNKNNNLQPGKSGDSKRDPLSIPSQISKPLNVRSGNVDPSHGIGITEMPLSEARLRRREVKERNLEKPSVKVRLKSQVDIKKYRADYTWNRGGRLKELRIRCLARKFVFIWMKNVFGRVRPSVARSLYEKRILKMVFSEWYDMWWEMRKEWRLMVRAECHFRYITWLKVINCWKYYAALRRVKRTKTDKAVLFYNEHLQQHHLNLWIMYLNQKRKTRILKQTADRFHDSNLVLKFWNRWTHQLSIKYDREALCISALQFWAQRIQKQHWQLWLDAFRRRKCQRQKIYDAIVHHNGVIATKCLHRWLYYLRSRQQKNYLKDYASKVSKLLLKRRMFVLWYRQLNLMQSFQRHEHSIDILILTLSSFHLNLVQERVKSMRQEKADDHRQKSLIKTCWNIWMIRCEANEELKMYPKTKRARMHYRNSTLKKHLHLWTNYLRWRQRRQAQYNRADAYFYLRSVPKFIFQMKVFVQLMKNKRELASKANHFRRENLQAQFFYTWFNEYEISVETRMWQRMAIIHYDAVLLKKKFRQWKVKTHEVLIESDKYEDATEHHQSRLCKNYFKEWVDYTHCMRRRHTHEVKAAEHYYLKITGKAFSALKQYIAYQKLKWEEKQRAAKHYEVRIYKKILHSWILYTRNARRINNIANERYDMKCSQTKRWAFNEWHINAQLQAEEKFQEMKAKIYHHRYVLIKVLTCWHRYAAIHAYKKSETRNLVESAKTDLNQGILKRHFLKWKQARDDALLQRLKYEQAVEHYHNVMYRQVMVTWKKFIISSVRKKVIVAWYEYYLYRKAKKKRIMDALERRRVRLLKDGLSQWIKVADALVDMRTKFAEHQQAKQSHTMWQNVRKCALHWKHWTARRTSRQSVTVNSKSNNLPVDITPVYSASPARPKVVTFFKHQDLKDDDRDLVLKNVPIRSRAKPRHPQFLIDSLKKAGLREYSESDLDEEKATTRYGNALRQADIQKDENEDATEITVEPVATNETKSTDQNVSSTMAACEQTISSIACDDLSHNKIDPSGDAVAYPLTSTSESQKQGSIHMNSAKSCKKGVVREKEMHAKSASSQAKVTGFKLLTPDDFISGTVISKDAKAQGLSHEDETGSNYDLFSPRLSTFSTPRLDADSDIYVLNNEDKKKSKKELQLEIISIRNRLKKFNEKKKELSSLVEQQKQLKDFIDCQKNSVHGEDEDIKTVLGELNEITEEVESLQLFIKFEKPHCAKLLSQVKELVERLKNYT